jgi:hypothetical protein
MDGRFSDNGSDGRFELDIAGQIAFANYAAPTMVCSSSRSKRRARSEARV